MWSSIGRRETWGTQKLCFPQKFSLPCPALTHRDSLMAQCCMCFCTIVLHRVSFTYSVPGQGNHHWDLSLPFFSVVEHNSPTWNRSVHWFSCGLSDFVIYPKNCHLVKHNYIWVSSSLKLEECLIHPVLPPWNFIVRSLLLVNVVPNSPCTSLAVQWMTFESLSLMTHEKNYHGTTA